MTIHTGTLTSAGLLYQSICPNLQAFQGESMMKRREFCRQLTLFGGAVVLAPLINSCAPDVDPSVTSDGQLTATAPPTATNTPFPPQPTETMAAVPSEPQHQPTESTPDDFHIKTTSQPIPEELFDDHGLTLLIAPHHGRKSGYSEEMMDTIDPHVVIICDKWGGGETHRGFRENPQGLDLNGVSEKYKSTKTTGRIKFTIREDGTRTYSEV